MLKFTFVKTETAFSTKITVICCVALFEKRLMTSCLNQHFTNFVVFNFGRECN